MIEIMDLGFTGTQKGIKPIRLAYLHQMLKMFVWNKSLTLNSAHHGMCIGADTQFHEIIEELDKSIILVGHPPTNKSKANMDLKCDIIRPAKDYLVRNHEIVDSSTAMIACPQTATEELRSGTWATIRYAKKVIAGNKSKCKKLWVMNPDFSSFDFFDFNRLTSDGNSVE